MYPVQFFHCKDIPAEKIERVFRDCVTIFGNLGIFAGPVHGETGIPGLLLDFNCGVRLEVPEGPKKQRHFLQRKSIRGLSVHPRTSS